MDRFFDFAIIRIKRKIVYLKKIMERGGHTYITTTKKIQFFTPE